MPSKKSKPKKSVVKKDAPAPQPTPPTVVKTDSEAEKFDKQAETLGMKPSGFVLKCIINPVRWAKFYDEAKKRHGGR